MPERLPSSARTRLAVARRKDSFLSLRPARLIIFPSVHEARGLNLAENARVPDKENRVGRVVESRTR